jgi:hypothetical protein
VGKHPDVDHDEQVDRLCAAAIAAGCIFRLTGCQGLCSFSNVVSLRQGPHKVVLGALLDDATTDAVATWIADPANVPADIDDLVVYGNPADIDGVAVKTPVSGSPSGANWAP